MERLKVAFLLIAGAMMIGLNDLKANIPAYYTPEVCIDSSGLISTKCLKYDPDGPCDRIESCKERMRNER